MSGKKQKKQVVLMIAKNFLAYHKRAGQATDFEIKIKEKEQIKQYNPPPNPAKITDPRAKDFIEKHGKTSWEVDALKPEVLNAILKQAIEENIDIDKFEEILAEEEADKEKLEELKNKL